MEDFKKITLYVFCDFEQNKVLRNNWVQKYRYILCVASSADVRNEALGVQHFWILLLHMFSLQSCFPPPPSNTLWGGMCAIFLGTNKNIEIVQVFFLEGKKCVKQGNGLVRER